MEPPVVPAPVKAKLKGRLRWLNIAGMPLLVTASGITIAFFKRKRTAAK